MPATTAPPLVPQVPWRTPGCTDDCALRTVILPGLLGRQLLAVHDATAHERFGRAEAGDLSAAVTLESGPLRLDRRSWRLFVDDVPVFCSPNEWGLLLSLIDGAGAVLPKATLLRRWGPGYSDAWHVLRVTLARLRARLGAASGLVETVPGLGYRFRFITPGEPAPPRTPRPTALAVSGRWSRDHDACRGCGTVARRHQSHGYCAACQARLRSSQSRHRRKRGPG